MFENIEINHNIKIINKFLCKEYPELRYFLTEDHILEENDKCKRSDHPLYKLIYPYNMITSSEYISDSVYFWSITNITNMVMPYAIVPKDVKYKIEDIEIGTNMILLNKYYDVDKVKSIHDIFILLNLDNYPTDTEYHYLDGIFKLNEEIDLIKLWVVKLIYLLSFKSFKTLEEWKEESHRLYNLFRSKKNIKISIFKNSPLFEIVINNKDIENGIKNCLIISKAIYQENPSKIIYNLLKYELVETDEESVEIKII